MDYKHIISGLVNRIYCAAEYDNSDSKDCDECSNKEQLLPWIVIDDGMTSSDYLCANCTVDHIMSGRVVPY